jgi:hypothetical protein
MLSDAVATLVQEINELKNRLEEEERELRDLQAVCAHAFRIKSTTTQDYGDGSDTWVHSLECIRCFQSRIMWEKAPEEAPAEMVKRRWGVK